MFRQMFEHLFAIAAKTVLTFQRGVESTGNNNWHNMQEIEFDSMLNLIVLWHRRQKIGRWRIVNRQAAGLGDV